MASYAFISGRLGLEPELRFTSKGTPVLNLSVASNRVIKNGEQRETIADWFKITVYGRDAEVIAQYAKKGSALAFNGRLQNEKYLDRDGNQRTMTVLVASSFEFVPAGKRGSSNADETPVNNARTKTTNDSKTATGEVKSEEDDIPF